MMLDAVDGNRIGVQYLLEGPMNAEEPAKRPEPEGDVTGRLRAHDERFRRVVENTEAGYFLIGMDGCYQDVNAAWLRMHGFTRREDAIGLHFSAVQTPKDLTQAGQVVEALMRGKSISGEFSRLRRDGAIGYHSFSANPVLDGDRVIGLEGFLIDVTERKQAEAALRASEERWRSIFENSAVGIALTDPGGFFTATNRAFQQLVGYADEELRSLSYLDITHEEDRSANSVLHRELWEGNVPQFTHEKRYRRKDGKLIWVRNTVSLVPGVETLPRFGLMLVEDITERKFAEEALRRSEENFATLFRCSPASITVSDLNDGDRFLEVNEAFENFTGHRREAVIGRTYPPDWLWVDPLEYAEAVSRFTQSGKLSEFEFRFHRKGGEIRTGILSADSIEFDGRPCVVATTVDITERKRAEDALRESEERFRNVADTCPAIIWRVGPDRQTTFLNKQAVTFSGRDMDELLGSGWVEMVHPDDLARLHFTVAAAVSDHDELPDRISDAAARRGVSVVFLYGGSGLCRGRLRRAHGNQLRHHRSQAQPGAGTGVPEARKPRRAGQRHRP